MFCYIFISLGHVAALTDLMATLGETKPALEMTIVVIFIANEENSSFLGIGVDQLEAEVSILCVPKLTGIIFSNQLPFFNLILFLLTFILLHFFIRGIWMS